jgi:PAS domain S-box-containing protein
LTEVLEHSPDGVLQTDAAGVLIYLNPAARDLLGLAPAESIGHVRFTDFLAEGARHQLAEVIFPALDSRGVWVGEIPLRLGQRPKVPFGLTALAHRSADGRALRYSAVLRDISADVQVRQQIQRQNAILGAITEALPATVVIVDSRGRYVFANSAFERHVGLDASQILGRTAVEVLGPEEVARRKPYMVRALAGEPVDFVLDYPGAQGSTHLALHCIPLKLDGVLDGFVGISQDVTSQRREQERLTHLAERDALTGLLNRVGLAQRFERKPWHGEGGEPALRDRGAQRAGERQHRRGRHGRSAGQPARSAGACRRHAVPRQGGRPWLPGFRGTGTGATALHGHGGLTRSN